MQSDEVSIMDGLGYLYDDVGFANQDPLEDLPGTFSSFRRDSSSLPKLHTSIDIGESYYQEIDNCSFLPAFEKAEEKEVDELRRTMGKGQYFYLDVENTEVPVEKGDKTEEDESEEENDSVYQSMLEEDKSVLESILLDDKNIALQKLTRIKTNLSNMKGKVKSTGCMNILISDVDTLIDYISKNKVDFENKGKTETDDLDDWIIMGEPDHTHMMTLLTRITDGYNKVISYYDSVSTACRAVVNSTEPIFAATQLAITFYKGGPIGVGVLLWSWFSRK